jgi:hypothetical protein
MLGLLAGDLIGFMDAHQIEAVAAEYPARLRGRLGAAALSAISALGDLKRLALPKTALFCSPRYPGSVILPTCDQTAKWRDAGCCVISGFHSPVEKECLQILLRGDAPVILCPARGMLERLPAQWAIAVAAGRLLLLSPFPARENRVTTDLARRRNEFGLFRDFRVIIYW